MKNAAVVVMITNENRGHSEVVLPIKVLSAVGSRKIQKCMV